MEICFSQNRITDDMIFIHNYKSVCMIKPRIWALPPEKAQSWLISLMLCDQWVGRDLRILHLHSKVSDQTDQTDLSLCRAGSTQLFIFNFRPVLTFFLFVARALISGAFQAAYVYTPEVMFC